MGECLAHHAVKVLCFLEFGVSLIGCAAAQEHFIDLCRLIGHPTPAEDDPTGERFTFEAGVTFASCEGIVPAPESSHSIRAVMDEALRCKESGEPKVLLFNLSGHGHFDMSAYDRYLAGDLVDFEYPEEAIDEAMRRLPKVDPQFG